MAGLENEVNAMKAAHDRLGTVDKDQLMSTVDKLEAEVVHVLYVHLKLFFELYLAMLE